MSSVGGLAGKLARAVGRAATMTTEAAGALGGAAVNGVIGGVTGVATGVQRGLGRGSQSTPAAALTLGALGAAGLVEWPLLLVVGGTALVLRQLNHAAPAPARVQPLASVKSPNSAAAAPPPRSP
ncbi:MAG: hypothetical protein ABI307_05400, partial [Mycobacterium sp.]